jgi:hypothetical protein
MAINYHGMETSLQSTYHVKPVDGRAIIKIVTKHKLSFGPFRRKLRPEQFNEI